MGRRRRLSFRTLKKRFSLILGAFGAGKSRESSRCREEGNRQNQNRFEKLQRFEVVEKLRINESTRKGSIEGFDPKSKNKEYRPLNLHLRRQLYPLIHFSGDLICNN